MKILSIDAWKDITGSWTWNDVYTIGHIESEDLEPLTTNQKLLKYMRDNGFLGHRSQGLVKIESDDSYITFLNRSNDCPFLAISLYQGNNEA